MKLLLNGSLFSINKLIKLINKCDIQVYRIYYFRASDK